MAHDNFENLLKKRLEPRRIAPSDNAWERISARKRPARKKPVTWYAASVAAVLLLAGWLWTDRQGVQPAPAPAVVSVPETEMPAKEAEIRNPDVLPTPKPLPAVAVEAAAEALPAGTPDDAMAQIDVPLPIPQAEERKIAEIVTTLDQLQQGGQTITEATVDSLLARAQRELALEKQQRQRTSPDNLLAEAETELDRSFKDRVFTAISKFKKVRVAFGNK